MRFSEVEDEAKASHNKDVGAVNLTGLSQAEVNGELDAGARERRQPAEMSKKLSEITEDRNGKARVRERGF